VFTSLYSYNSIPWHDTPSPHLHPVSYYLFTELQTGPLFIVLPLGDDIAVSLSPFYVEFLNSLSGKSAKSFFVPTY